MVATRPVVNRRTGGRFAAAARTGDRSEAEGGSVGVILAFCSAIVYGCADFCGGKATRRASAYTVTASSQLIGFTVVLVGLVVLPGRLTTHDLVLGALGGVGGGAGIMLLYHSLAHGTMSIVSPVTAVMAAIVPVVSGVALFGERPSTPAFVGIGCSLLAIALVSLSHDGGGRDGVGRSILTAAAAGVCFGVFYVFLARCHDQAGLWPLVAARPVSIGMAVAVARFNRASVLVLRDDWRLVAPAGLMDMGANVLYLFATHFGLLAVTGVLASLYPVSTVALAGTIDHERLRPVQWAGLVFAVLALVLIALK